MTTETQPATEGKELVYRMYASGCFSHGKLMYWPEWLTYEMVTSLVEAGYMTRKTYGPATYAHTEYEVTL